MARTYSYPISTTGRNYFLLHNCKVYSHTPYWHDSTQTDYHVKVVVEPINVVYRVQISYDHDNVSGLNTSQSFLYIKSSRNIPLVQSILGFPFPCYLYREVRKAFTHILIVWVRAPLFTWLPRVSRSIFVSPIHPGSSMVAFKESF